MCILPPHSRMTPRMRGCGIALLIVSALWYRSLSRLLFFSSVCICAQPREGGAQPYRQAATDPHVGPASVRSPAGVGLGREHMLLRTRSSLQSDLRCEAMHGASLGCARPVHRPKSHTAPPHTRTLTVELQYMPPCPLALQPHTAKCIHLYKAVQCPLCECPQFPTLSGAPGSPWHTPPPAACPC